MFRPAQIVTMFCLLLLAPLSSFSETSSTFYTQQNITRWHFLRDGLLISNSDSLLINSQLLKSGVDYNYNRSINAFDLSRITLNPTDTLFIKYETAPEWLKSFYGRPMEEADQLSSKTKPEINLSAENSQNYQSRVDFSGSKTFRVSSNNANSNFGQSLDLRLDGQLTEKIKISGAISDRGYNSEYGTFNGRLNELDKIKLRLYSDLFQVELGETSMPSKSRRSNKQLTGLSVSYDNQKINFYSVVARPKGKYESIAFAGIDNRQGPYQINISGRFQPVVPGSESVWLDGELLKRGSLNDYSIDYSAGEITFSVDRPISSKNRIEIDFEPVETTYRQEFLGAGGGYRVSDSSYYFQLDFTREGDNKDDFLLDNFNEADRQLLETVGDNSSLAVRSGVSSDSLGDYILVVDSLPDSVYQYVGDGAGDYSISFSYYGENKGSYRFAGGGRYLYVGDSLGEYLPVVNVPLPQRTDYLSLNGGYNEAVFGRWDLQFNLSSFDQNLLSDINDGDNQSWSGKVDWEYNWVKDLKAVVRVRHQDKDFKTQQRLFEPNIARKFYAPDNQLSSEKRTLYDVYIDRSFGDALSLAFYRGKYKYGSVYDADKTGVETKLKSNNGSYFENKLYWTNSDFNSGDTSAVGKELDYLFDSRMNLSKRWAVVNSYNYDFRKNDYKINQQKIHTHRVNSALENGENKLGVEYYNEDSTYTATSYATERTTVYLNLSQKYKNYTLNTRNSLRRTKSYQTDETVLLNRMKLTYYNSRRQLNWGADYLLSSETRNSRGITYLKVTEGEGDYIYEDGTYIRDLNGDYIRVEEILSDQSKVKRGEKNFYLSQSSGNLIYRLQSDIKEELLDSESRDLLWVIPFYSNKYKAYFFYTRRYNADVKSIPINGGYLFNFQVDWFDEGRTIGGELKAKTDWKTDLSLRQSYRESFFEQILTLFENKRDSYYNGGTDGKINGYKLAANYIQQTGSYRFTSGLSYRKAKTETDEDSRIVALTLKGQRRMPQRGEIRAELELYQNDLNIISSSTVFLLTDNRPGERGAIWNLLVRYGLSRELKINLNINGRHADNRSARITGRAELVAEF